METLRPSARRPRARAIGRGVVLFAAVLGAPRAGGDPAPGVRGAVDVYERSKPSIRACVVHAARDLKDRAAAWPPKPGGAAVGAVLSLVVDPTSSLAGPLLELREALVEAVAEGPPGIRFAVKGVACEEGPPGPIGPARDALTALSLAPVDGAKNLLEAVREAADDLHLPITEPRAILLVTREGGDGEDDVEATRATLRERGVAFYSIAPEAAFERPWIHDFIDRPVPDLGLTQRWTPMPRRRVKGEIFVGGDVAFGLVPYDWELRRLPLAQTEFAFAGGGMFPCPSGFGYWCLATLSYTTGGRAFVFDFARGGGTRAAQAQGVPLYDLGFLNLYAPDLRPRQEIVRALGDDRKATTIVRIWEHLADEEAPNVRDHGTLERAGRGLVPRAMRPVRSETDVDGQVSSAKEVVKERERVVERRRRVEQALGWWADEARRATTPGDGAGLDPLRKRVDADFDLLGFQLRKMRFHWGELLAALDEIDLSVLDGARRVVLVPVPLAVGCRAVRSDVRILGLERTAAFADATLVGRRLAEAHHGTPWALVVERGTFVTFSPVVVDPRPRPPSGGGDGPRPSGPPPKPSRPSAPPPPPPRPSSGAGGETTGNGR